ncbi:MAG: anhydro-N-acetylmuramic acid kinase [Bacteroidetes bacterium]|nr:MAG: anhydro-N-acetylmuramic acid kinase [Bacteroidota bacterium]
MIFVFVAHKFNFFGVILTTKIKNHSKMKVIGLMSGTSTDGVDIAYCDFELKNQQWNFKIIEATTKKYDSEWVKKLKNAVNLPGTELMALDAEYGTFLGQLVKDFTEDGGFQPNLIASHGHTVFHNPAKYSFQIGSGAHIAAKMLLPVVSNFRQTDTAKGGQGAPLVSLGDKLLFHEYDACLNLGGFANISFDWKKERIGFDICPVNVVLNYVASKLFLPFDPNGENAAKGKMIPELYRELNHLEYYQMHPPKSLGMEWVNKFVIPLIEKYSYHEIPDILHTLTEHIAMQIAKVLNHYSLYTVLTTGGGVYNSYLITRINAHLDHKKIPQGKVLAIPEPDIIDFKEALIFAFLGMLRYQRKINILSSYTGAESDSVGGTVWFP